MGSITCSLLNDVDDVFPAIHVITPLPTTALCKIADLLKAIRCLCGETELVKSCIQLLKNTIATSTTESVILSTMFLYICLLIIHYHGCYNSAYGT